MTYLTKVTEVYRVNSEKDAAAMIEDAKSNTTWRLAKYSCVHKEKKAKGEVIDDWYHLELVKVFCDEKEPDVSVSVSYV